ncbi:MAG: hypothetical protein FJ098_06790 [Deltaproteobacteria bacterium]|nr:hypothetical protein [Deltaproteobacteria bacterium]
MPLLILFGASNELPEDDSLRALWDRFLVRMPVMGVQGEAAWRSLGDACPAMPGSPPVSRATVTATVDMGDIRQAWAEVWQMPLSDMARDGLLELRSALASEGVSVSGRRWQAAVMLGRARAWLSGAQEVHLHHLGVMTWALWDALGMQEMSGAIATVDRIVLGLCQPDALESVKLEDAAWELMKDKPATDDPDLVRKLEPLLLQLKAIRDDLADKVGKAPADDGARIREAHGKVQQWHQELAKLALRAMSRLSL